MKKYLISLICLFFLFASCKKDDSVDTITLQSPANKLSELSAPLILTWESTATSFDIYCDGNSNPSAKINTAVLTEKSYFLTALEPNTTYYWKVVSSDKSAESEVWSFTTAKESDFEKDMVLVEGGTFDMGDTFGDGSSDENPVHSVTLDSYYISKYELTQALWTEILITNPSVYKGKNRPIESVSWDIVQEFITKLNKKTGLNYRLPTEAEWEFAARGGNKSQGYKYSGNNHIGHIAWYRENSDDKTQSIGQKQANELGLYDMSGNVWEWCNDWYGIGYYKQSPQNNPKGPSSGSNRVLRGGSFFNNHTLCRITGRYYDGQIASSGNIGFRLARSLK